MPGLLTIQKMKAAARQGPVLFLIHNHKGIYMPKDPKKPAKQKQVPSNPKSDKSNTTKGKPAESNGGMGGMIGEGRADEGSRGGMKGEQ